MRVAYLMLSSFVAAAPGAVTRSFENANDEYDSPCPNSYRAEAVPGATPRQSCVVSAGN